MGQRKKHRVQPLGQVNFTKVIFRPIKRLKLIINWCPERSAKFYSTLSREAKGEDIGVPRGVQPASMEDRLVRALNARFCGFAAQQRSRQNRYATQVTQTAKQSTVFDQARKSLSEVVLVLACENKLHRTVFVIMYKIKGNRAKLCVIVSTLLIFMFADQLLLVDVFSHL